MLLTSLLLFTCFIMDEQKRFLKKGKTISKIHITKKNKKRKQVNELAQIDCSTLTTIK